MKSIAVEKRIRQNITTVDCRAKTWKFWVSRSKELGECHRAKEEKGEVVPELAIVFNFGFSHCSQLYSFDETSPLAYNAACHWIDCSTGQSVEAAQCYEQRKFLKRTTSKSNTTSYTTSVICQSCPFSFFAVSLSSPSKTNIIGPTLS